jgi:hypothetical protein
MNLGNYVSIPEFALYASFGTKSHEYANLIYNLYGRASFN